MNYFNAFVQSIKANLFGNPELLKIKYLHDTQLRSGCSTAGLFCPATASAMPCVLGGQKG
jgi:hypothetical protein